MLVLLDQKIMLNVDNTLTLCFTKRETYVITSEKHHLMELWKPWGDKQVSKWINKYIPAKILVENIINKKQLMICTEQTYAVIIIITLMIIT